MVIWASKLEFPVPIGVEFLFWYVVITFVNGKRVLLNSGCMDIDLALCEDEPPIPMESSTQSQKDAYEKWKQSNCLSLISCNLVLAKALGVHPTMH